MKLPKVELNSDFHESYDHMFDTGETEFVWHRMSVNMDRRTALDVLRQRRLAVPYYDKVENMYALLSELRPFVVVYTDPFAHRGEGKELRCLSLDTLQKYCDKLAMLYVDQVAEVSYRYLRMGTKKMWLRYESSDDAWRSNCGDVEITEISRPSVHQSGFYDDPGDHPAVAIDFVSSVGGKWFAIDYNTSPGIDHTPFTHGLCPGKYSAPEIVDSVKEWFHNNAHRLTPRTVCPHS